MIAPRARPAAVSRHRRQRGLTVLELVSALALFVIIFGMLLVALNSATDMWSLSAEKNRNLQKARQALDWIASDLASAVAPQSQAVRDAAAFSTTPGTAAQPLFLEEGNANRIGLYFIRARAPSEQTGDDQVSLELVAYQWTTNGLSRYTRPVQAQAGRTEAPDLAEQLRLFQSRSSSVSVPSNILSSSIVDFEPRLYQPLSLKSSTTATKPTLIQPSGGKVALADLPDFVDIHLAYINPNESASSSYHTNYLTRRIALPAAQASRLP